MAANVLNRLVNEKRPDRLAGALDARELSLLRDSTVHRIDPHHRLRRRIDLVDLAPVGAVKHKPVEKPA